ncbi:MAG: hypothetical protein HY426_02915 [Candidatus Levybacteria bacterium]|nr:hypothetical protein [Candidatus Levybacteria bacterium]
MVDVYVEREVANRPSRRSIEKIGEGPDTTGSIVLYDGATNLDIDLTRVHPAHDWNISNQARHVMHWPIRITSHPVDTVASTQSPYLERIAQGVTMELDDYGVGKARVTGTRSLIVGLSKPIITRGRSGHTIISKYYPDYPELSGEPSASDYYSRVIPHWVKPGDPYSESQPKPWDQYAWVDLLSKDEINRLSDYLKLMNGKLRQRISDRTRQIYKQEQEDWIRNHPGGNWI